jgi:hypothetical protein
MNGLPSAFATNRNDIGASKASKTTFIAPVRSSVAPVRINRQMLCGPRMLDFPSRMQRCDTHCHIAVFCVFEPSDFQHSKEGFLIRKIADLFHKV